ncbi:mannosyl-N-acetyl-alpha-D-glucosaminyl-diphospho-ditrans,octacis-undecaprenol 3-alpha-mannosyltransferase / alpha-1,3-rhamnosyltransferase [Rhodocyclaceae bacterium]|nr:mannosyl-N-acetyl-alpha-D-glucosaminyl-diphospho-ditrans,octacis-undecaprenol 3-alpha-mannosyltransferase / alpha-1,3-rhamnosyltransferase [Rhodocyclaceae bacterium]
MRIAIDASTISTQGGPRTYVLGLVEALLAMDRENEYVIFYNDPCHLGRFPGAKEIVLPGKNPAARLVREHLRLPLACSRERIDLLHCPKSAIPFFSPCPTVVTLHDLIPIKHPETEKFAARLYWRLQIPIAARRSAFIITDSAHARAEIMADFRVPTERIRAVMLGFNPAMLEPRDPAAGKAVRARYGLPDGYILYVGTIQPRKNLATLIEAFSLLRREGSVTAKLVIVGRKGWLYDALFARLRELQLEEAVIFTGFVPDEELPFIYDGAAVFAYLSLFEGFGLPPLEAMACGVPVITSNTTSLPEVVGDAGFAIPPTDVMAVADALRRVLSDPLLAGAMREKGLARARLFSWEAAARETLDIYRQAAHR